MSDVLSMVVQLRYWPNDKQCNRKNVWSYIMFHASYVLKMMAKNYCEYVDLSDCDSDVPIY